MSSRRVLFWIDTELLIWEDELLLKLSIQQNIIVNSQHRHLLLCRLHCGGMVMGAMAVPFVKVLTPLLIEWHCVVGTICVVEANNSTFYPLHHCCRSCELAPYLALAYSLAPTRDKKNIPAPTVVNHVEAPLHHGRLTKSDDDDGNTWRRHPRPSPRVFMVSSDYEEVPWW